MSYPRLNAFEIQAWFERFFCFVPRDIAKEASCNNIICNVSPPFTSRMQMLCRALQFVRQIGWNAVFRDEISGISFPHQCIAIETTKRLCNKGFAA
jgi:hypothetical protein